MNIEQGSLLKCYVAHPDGNFTVGRTYKVNSYQVGVSSVRIRIRDNKRQRRDFNLLETSRNYLWNYFSPIGKL